jgi:hypothetical protein
MAAEGHNGGSSPSENPTRVEHSLDEVARGLADGTLSRGKALKWMGSALVGAALASVPGVAWANDRCPKGESRCNDRCVNLKTNERHCGSCRNRCGSKQTCCGGRCVNLKRSERHCGSCSNRCAEGEECDHGVCTGGTCPQERTLTEGDCNCAFHCGDSFPSPATCQDNPNCLCYETTEHTGFCAGSGDCAQTCTSSDQCPSGWKCVRNTCCANSPTICLPPCTPTCAQNGSICTDGSQCCSGNCKDSACVESCIPPNAIPCDPNNPTTCGSASGCNCLPEVSGPETFCRSSVTDTLCINSCDCPDGQFCEPFGDESFCVVAC